MYFFLKVLITAGVVVGVSEVSKRSVWMGSILGSLPLTSILALSWLYLESRDSEQVRNLSMGIFWMVLPSLVFFVTLSGVLKLGLKFVPSLLIASGVMAVSYAAYTALLKNWGVTLD
jgi:hypothetical protein